MSKLPPSPLPALPDPSYGGDLSPYSESALRDVCGTRINPDSKIYERRQGVVGRPLKIKTCAHPFLEKKISEVRSFDPHSRVTQKSLQDWQMSAIIPRLSVWGDSLPFEIPKECTYSIDYHYLHSNPLSLPDRENALNLRERFSDETHLMLAFFNDRKLVEGLWQPLGFWHHPFVKQFDSVIMPDFSAFNNDPVVQYLYGERQMQIFAEEGCEAGHNIIPTIAWASGESLRRQMELWTSSYPYVNTIHLDCHGSGVNKTGWAWHWLFAMEEYCAHFPHIRWLISGMQQGWVFRELNRIFPKKNYCIMPSVSTMLSVLSGGSRDPEWQAVRFREKIGRFQDLRSGKEVAESQPRPDHWLMFNEVLEDK